MEVKTQNALFIVSLLDNGFDIFFEEANPEFEDFDLLINKLHSELLINEDNRCSNPKWEITQCNCGDTIKGLDFTGFIEMAMWKNNFISGPSNECSTIRTIKDTFNDECEHTTIYITFSIEKNS